MWKYWKGCMKKLDGNDPKLLPTAQESCITKMHLFTQHCEGVLATTQITVLEHPAYSLDLSPSDFFLFPKIKEILK
jgi:hypothetical protein